VGQLSRRLTVLLAVCLAALILGGVALFVLPEVVRRVAVAKIPELTGRAASIGRVELNLFTGRFAIANFSMARRPGQGPEAFVQFERLAGRLALGSLLGREIRLVELSLARPIVRMTRTGRAEFDFADILERFAQPAAPPSRWTVSLGRLEITEGVVLLTDAYLSPPQEWRLDGLGIEASGLSTRRAQPPGRLRLRAGLGPTTLRLTSDAVLLTPLDVSLDVSIADFDLARVRPYLPATLPAFPQSGKLRLDLRLARVGAEDLGQAAVSGEVSVEGLSVLQPDRSTPFLTLDRFRVAIKAADLLGSHVALDAIEAAGLDVKVARDRTGRIDLVAAFGGGGAPAEPEAPAPPVPGAGPRPSSPGSDSETPRGPPSPPAPRKVTLERLTLQSGTATFHDEGVSPAREWKIQGMTIDGARFSTSPEDAPATARVRAQITARPGLLTPATLALDADPIRLAPPSATARVSLQGLALAALEPYWPPTTPVVAPAGSVGLALTVSAEPGDGGLRRAVVSGAVRGEGLTAVRRGETTPFLSVPKLAVVLKQADAVARTVAVGAVEIEGADLTVMRDALGRIGLLDVATVAQPAVEVVKSRTGLRADEPVAKAPPPPAPAGPEWRVSVDRFALAKGRFTFDDAKVSPRTSLAAGDVAVVVQRLTWPFTTPASFSFSMSMPGGGQTQAKGTAVLEPLNVHVALATRDSPIEPYQAYLPFSARLRGLFSGDSQNEIQRGPTGELILASRGTAWARALEVWAPGAPAPVARMDEMEIRGIDFSWPNYALVERVTLRHPQVQIERDAQGAINLRTLFAPANEAPSNAAASAEPAVPEPSRAEGKGDGGAPGGGEAQRTVLDFTEMEIVDGYARFIDRTTTPPFSQDLSRLTLKIRGLSNVFGRPERTTMTAQAAVGADGALDMRGELSGIGEALRADLIAELRDYTLPSANPYAESLTSWVIQRGKLQASIHYRIEGDRISAEHNLDFKGLRVAKAREADLAQRRIGVPLGLAVALLKDSHGDIDFSIPLHGTLGDKSFNWGEAMWEGVKQVITKLLLAPFHAMGRLFAGGGDAAETLEVNPVTFASGSPVVAPAMEAQLTRVADLLRRSPAIKLKLASVVTTADAASLKLQAVTARLQEFRREHDLPDLPAALVRYYRERLPDVARPPTVDEQLALLAEREPLPARPLAELGQRRLDAARQRLVTVEGIPAERLAVLAAAPATEPTPATSGEGRVEFTIVEADE
jgi:uncharacterized protein DUF748